LQIKRESETLDTTNEEIVLEKVAIGPIEFDWLIRVESNILDPLDGNDPIYYWWEDMRAREIRELVKKVFERGIEYAIKLLKEKKHDD
jgi:hypothetical protein